MLSLSVSLPGLLFGAHTLACKAGSPPGWTRDYPLVGVFGRRLTDEVHGTSSG